MTEVVMLTQPACAMCKTMARLLGDKVRIVDVVEEESYREVMDKYNTLNLPTYLVYKNGEIVSVFYGMMPAKVFDAKVQNALDVG